MTLVVHVVVFVAFAPKTLMVVLVETFLLFLLSFLILLAN
jgi:hypothetical protein